MCFYSLTRCSFSEPSRDSGLSQHVMYSCSCYICFKSSSFLFEKKMASRWAMALFSRRSAVNYRAFANDITKCEVCTYILSHIGVPHTPSISLCLSCKIHLFTSNPLCGAYLFHLKCAAYLLSLLHNEWLSGALTVQRHHVCPVLKNWEYTPKTGVCCVHIS